MLTLGKQLALQTIAYTLVFTNPSGRTSRPRATIITTLAPSVILPLLRNAIRVQVLSKLGPAHQSFQTEVRACLEHVAISRVFDIVGLWQVIGELEDHRKKVTVHDGTSRQEPQPPPQAVNETPPSSQRSPSPVATLPPLRPKIRTEVLDSEGEEDDMLSSPTTPTKSISPEPIATAGHGGRDDDKLNLSVDTLTSNMPDILLLTHFSTLLSTLFTQSDRANAHTTLQLLSTHLRYLARTTDRVILLLNTTASQTASSSTSAGGANSYRPADLRTEAAPLGPDDPGVPPGLSHRTPSSRPLDPSLRSIFNPAPMSTTGMGYAAAGLALSRRNKPAFGLTFTQFLDLHLLCTKIPRTRADAEALYAPATKMDISEEPHAQQYQPDEVEYCWVVEVLLDECGAWKTNNSNISGAPPAITSGDKETRVHPPPRMNREQRWGAVQINSDSKVENAFGNWEELKRQRLLQSGPIRLAGGFGGRRV